MGILETLPAEVTRKAADIDPGPAVEVGAGWSRELIKAIAMDIGKEVAAYIEVQYPEAVKATSSTFLLSVRNSIHNQIMAAIEVNDAGEIAVRLERRKKHRREWKAAWKKIRAK